ncbi:hypothetical protein [Flavobacterium subsaxonicum]|uniref:Redox-active disulfide protein 2 n=1 Tax=Flavobacterium subsaxonicum WB 4.1-42 = DSM 21790 TaxID=1121898 RepID=A0A0A2MQU7_9FLAO|nr:hypothetical protein [Flavobacterium subsaxonicum]KGO94664.1 hypothetical protein Q766_00645 [Flavobacterium subsaxonicum WB 4.1-42 = DSM 21790]
MKKTRPLNELSMDELQQKKKVVLGATIGLGIVMVVACIISIYVAIIAKQPALLVIAVCCPTTFLPIFINLQRVNSEIKNRPNQ